MFKGLTSIASAFVASCFLVLPAIAEAQTAGVSFNKFDDRVEVLLDGRPVTTFHFHSKWDKPFLYPIRTLSGTILSFGIPEAGIMTILAIDEILDMARTSVNVLGNCLATAVIARWEGVDLSKEPELVEL